MVETFDLMDIKEVAQLLHLSPAYLRNNWPVILGIKPEKIRPQQRKLLFSRKEVMKKLAEPK